MGKFTLKSLNDTSRAAILSPMAGSMEITSNASIGVAEKQELAFVGIESILEKTLSIEESIKLLSCFTVDEANTVLSGPNANNEVNANTTPMYDVGLSNETDFTTILKSLINTASQRDANHGPSSAVGDNVSSVLGDGLREYLNSLLASNGLLDLLEASNVLNIEVTLKDTEGAKDMYDVIRGNTGRITSADAKAKRRLFLTQIPKATLDGYLFRGTGNESIKHIDFLPLKGGDSMTFVFDILVRPPQNLTAVGKNASADDYTGANIQNDSAYVIQQGKYTDATVSLNGEVKTRRVAFVAHFGTQVELFPQDFSDAQIEAVTVPAGQETVANYTAAFNKVPGAKLVSSATAVPASMQTAVNTASVVLHKAKLASIEGERAVADAAYEALTVTEQDALVAKVQAQAALDSMNAYLASLSAEYTTAIGTEIIEQGLYDDASTANTAWSTNAMAGQSAWETLQASTLNALLASYTAVQTLSQEIPSLALMKADAYDEFYPNDGTSTVPKKLATLSAELDAARALTESKEDAYQVSGSAGDFSDWQLARAAQVTAERAYARKVYITADANKVLYLNRYTDALTALGNAEAARDAKKTAYISQFQTPWSLVNDTPTPGIPNPANVFVDPNTQGSPVAYQSSSAFYNGYAGMIDDADLLAAQQDVTRLEALYNDQVGAVAGAQVSYNSANTAYIARAAAQTTYTTAVAKYNTDKDALDLLGLLSHLAISAVAGALSTAAVMTVANAQPAYDDAKKAIAKAQARFNIVSSKVTNYLRSAAATTTLYMPSKV